MIAKKTATRAIFDTRFDTKKIFVTTSNRFSLRGYVDKSGSSLIYLDVSDKHDRIRLNTEVYIPRHCWDQKKQRIKNHINGDALNLVLENIESRITTIKTSFMLQDRFLDAKTLISEFQSATPDFDFISFCRHHMALQECKEQTKKNYRCILKKLETFSKEIPIHKINMQFLQRYRKFYIHNSVVTYNTDLKFIKKFLNIARSNGIKLNINLDLLKVNVSSSKTVYLEPLEMKQMIKYYFNEFINESHILPLGYFLFSCYTGLRISDIQERTREEILEEKFQFSSVKTDSTQFMRLNPEARKMVEFRPELFTNKLSDQKINAHLKDIATVCKINKVVSMHVGRHTFATTFIRNKGDIYRLKTLLGHAKIEHTQKYVHLVRDEHLDDLDIVSFT